MLGRRARARAARLLDDVVEAFRPLGYREGERPSPLEARLEPTRDGLPLRIRFAEQGRVFGGNLALEVSSADPLLPAPAGGLVGRPRGAIRLRGVSFRSRAGGAAEEALAHRLSEDAPLASALARVHFERVRVDPDGRPVLRHVGGSVVWMLFPPLVRAVPLVPEQAAATVAALEAFARLR